MHLTHGPPTPCNSFLYCGWYQARSPASTISNERQVGGKESLPVKVGPSFEWYKQHHNFYNGGRPANLNTRHFYFHEADESNSLKLLQRVLRSRWLKILIRQLMTIHHFYFVEKLWIVFVVVFVLYYVIYLFSSFFFFASNDFAKWRSLMFMIYLFDE